jgi:lysozyme
MPRRNLSKEAIDLIKSFEGLRLKAYICPGGVWTIGYGHTGGVKAGQTVTREHAEAMLIADLVRYQEGVDAAIRVPLNDNEYGALVSFCYNVGYGALAKSTLAKLLNGGDRKGAAAQFMRWTRGGGKVLPGLTRRRRAEQALFLRA